MLPARLSDLAGFFMVKFIVQELHSFCRCTESGNLEALTGPNSDAKGEKMEQSTKTVAPPVSRTQIVIRLLYSVLFLVILGVVNFLIQLATVFQYIMLLITLSPSEPVRRVTNLVAVYGYRVMRYLTLNDNARPFPFTEFPPEMEPPISEVRFE
jgi:hypothetical protein